MSLDLSARTAANVRPGGYEAPPGPATPANQRFSWLPVLLAFVIIAGIAVFKAIWTAKTVPLIDDTDDAMRLVTVRDLLAGQNWFDHLQHRLNTPFGAEIHWSHLVDAAIGGVILLLRPFAGSMTETIAVSVWPLLLLFALLALSARLAFRLAGREAILPAVVLPAVSPVVMTEFSPGRIDHHSIQILLLLLMAWGAIETVGRPRFAILVGIAAALSLTIGIEGLPSIVSAVLALSLVWVASPERAPALRNFGLSFAGATLLLFAQAYPPGRWFEPACDEISFVYVAFAVGIGVVLTLLSVLPLGQRPAWQRLVVGAVLGTALALGLAAAFPLCLGGPYAAMDPWLVHNWLDNIGEAKSLWRSISGFAPFIVGAAVPPVLGLFVIGFRVLRGERQGRGEWLILGLFLAIAVAVMCAQMRGARLAVPLAIPAAAWLILAARRRYLSGRQISGAIGMVASWLGFAGLIIAVAIVLVTMPFGSGVVDTPAGDQQACRMPSAYELLASLAPARAMTPVDLGSHLLMLTPHSVVAAPYQRDERGVLDAFHFFNGPIAEARQILDGRGVTLVAVCPAMPEMQGLDPVPDSFVKLFAENRLPAWLEEISAPTDTLKVYRVLPQ